MGSRISGGRHSQKERQAGTNRSCRCSTPIMPGRTGKACRSGSPTVTDATTGYRVITALWRRPANLRPASALAACVLDRGPGRVDRVQPRLHRSPFWNGHRGRSAARPFLAARRLGARRATGHSPPHRSSERRQGSHYRRAGSYRGGPQRSPALLVDGDRRRSASGPASVLKEAPDAPPGLYSPSGPCSGRNAGAAAREGQEDQRDASHGKCAVVA